MYDLKASATLEGSSPFRGASVSMPGTVAHRVGCFWERRLISGDCFLFAPLESVQCTTILVHCGLGWRTWRKCACGYRTLHGGHVMRRHSSRLPVPWHQLAPEQLIGRLTWSVKRQRRLCSGSLIICTTATNDAQTLSSSHLRNPPDPTERPSTVK